jgi:hypothetical protein
MENTSNVSNLHIFFDLTIVIGLLLLSCFLATSVNASFQKTQALTFTGVLELSFSGAIMLALVMVVPNILKELKLLQSRLREKYEVN